MSYHRTGGKGGTRNSPRERHADRFLPNFNKSTSGGHSRKPSKGRRMDNPGKGSKPKDTPEQRYKRMMGGQKMRRTGLDRALSGKSGITDKY
jgi:hypothetical protein